MTPRIDLKRLLSRADNTRDPVVAIERLDLIALVTALIDAVEVLRVLSTPIMNCPNTEASSAVSISREALAKLKSAGIEVGDE
jgi:hypothetical protein